MGLPVGGAKRRGDPQDFYGNRHCTSALLKLLHTRGVNSLERQQWTSDAGALLFSLAAFLLFIYLSAACQRSEKDDRLEAVSSPYHSVALKACLQAHPTLHNKIQRTERVIGCLSKSLYTMLEVT